MFLGIEKHRKEKTAFIDDDKNTVTYQGVLDFCHTYSKNLKRRSLLFLLCQNAAGAVINYLACLENDIVPLLLNASMDEELLAALCQKYKPEYLCIPTDGIDKHRALLGDGNIILEQYRYSVIEVSSVSCPMHDKLALLMSTSGSTGSSKLVRYSKENLEANARNVAKVFEWTEKEKPICDLPMNYTMGLNVINSHLIVGATVVLTDYNLMSPDYWNIVKQEQCTNFTGVPFSYSILAKLRVQKMELPYLTTLAEGGGRLSENEFRMWAEYASQHGKRFFATFGTTETSARMAYLPPHLPMEKTGSIGIAIPEGELFLLDEDGKELKEIEAQGELGYRGPNVTLGYAVCREDFQSGDVFCGEYHTGDIARRDQDGCYYIVGRKSRFIKLLGMRVSLDECERLIRDKMQIENICMGTDDKMVIYITSEERCDDVSHFISSKLRLYRSVFDVRYIKEIPRSESGKVLYQQLAV